ncbi:hypothetical protein G7Y89_g12322 [Cudoniella acicularis]|uniref:Uncharacterized protein n=1 Tax=Cudoniella acicularis TaxID=354080 RepID=A0A8H4RBM0_9HELO|nr:hypothetical protein G7Y89_g12322 [Cudoniella acicularis]
MVFHYLHIALLVYCGVTSAQNAYPFGLNIAQNTTASTAGSDCAAIFTSANATTTYNAEVGGLVGSPQVNGSATQPGDDPFLSWTIQVAQSYDTSSQTSNVTSSLFLGTPSWTDLRTTSSPYSGCAFYFNGLPANMILRGQNDTGDCHSLFSADCVSALTTQAANAGYYLTRSQTNNLTDGILPSICSRVLNVLTAEGAVPSACSEFVGSDMTWGGASTNLAYGAITSSSPDSNLANQCTFDESTLPNSKSSTNTNQTLMAQWGNYGISNNTLVSINYDNGTQQVVPIITTLFPAAYQNRTFNLDGAEALMTCARASTIQAGSREPEDLPSATSSSNSDDDIGISNTVLDLIIIAVIAVVIAIPTGIWLCFILWRKRVQKRRRGAANDHILLNMRLKEQREVKDKEEQEEATTPMLHGEMKMELEAPEWTAEAGMGLPIEMDGTMSGFDYFRIYIFNYVFEFADLSTPHNRPNLLGLGTFFTKTSILLPHTYASPSPALAPCA